MLLQVVEDRAHLGRLHLRLEVVEERVVGLVELAVEALDVAVAELEVLAQRRQEGGEVVALAGLDPDRDRERRRARHLRAQLGGDLARLLPVAAGDADQARLERVVLVLRLEGLELLEEPTDLGRGELVVGDAPERRELLGATGCSAGRHHHLLVPGEQRGGMREIGDLRQPPCQLVERSHPPHELAPYRT